MDEKWQAPINKKLSILLDKIPLLLSNKELLLLIIRNILSVLINKNVLLALIDRNILLIAINKSILVLIEWVIYANIFFLFLDFLAIFSIFLFCLAFK